ncbi:unnamed protein product, partial [Discosporangium mesarthrocarpum]
MLEAKVMETPLHGSVTRTFRQEHFAKLRTTHRHLLLRYVGFWKKKREDHFLLHLIVLQKTGCELKRSSRSEVIIYGLVVHMEDTHLPKRIMFVQLVHGVRNRG